MQLYRAFLSPQVKCGKSFTAFSLDDLIALSFKIPVELAQSYTSAKAGCRESDVGIGRNFRIDPS